MRLSLEYGDGNNVEVGLAKREPGRGHRHGASGLLTRPAGSGEPAHTTHLIGDVITKPALSITISPGELIDRLTILAIKQKRISDPDKQARIRRELDALRHLHSQWLAGNDELRQLQAELQTVNEAIWQVEDALRLCERNQEFEDEFLALARSVYHHNDQRSALKHQINVLVGSTLEEVKAYTTYR